MTLGPAPSLTERSAPGPREDEADARGPLLNASAPGVARPDDSRPNGTHPYGIRPYGTDLGGEGTYAAGREPAEGALRRCSNAGRLVQANRGFLDHAAAPRAQHTGLRRFPDLGCGLPAPANLGNTVNAIDTANPDHTADPVKTADLDDTARHGGTARTE
ncbi:SAM-dependent methyltransferase [Actinomadura sp. KC06]|uniref:SAM-dependent methyltransferase n=1 Tax=Actinomadura sp. KC06 TaxID=2530369 RepID=UPI001404EB3F|nr:SAM-dependent methyltransferase [Actinomadura sp. KC06]